MLQSRLVASRRVPEEETDATERAGLIGQNNNPAGYHRRVSAQVNCQTFSREEKGHAWVLAGRAYLTKTALLLLFRHIGR